MKHILKYISCLCILTATGLGTQPAIAAYPERPIKLIVPFPAGGTTDSIARLIAQELSNKLSQQVVVDYKAGAATIIGAEHTAKSEPDGYTVMLGTATTFTVNPILYPDLSYDPIKSFTPIGIVGTTSLALLANQSEPANDLKTLLDEIRKAPGKYSYGSHGSGSTVHFAAEMLWSAAKVEAVHVPFKGAAPALTNLMGGQIPISFDAVPAAATALKSGRIKAIAVTGPERSPTLPDVPTVAESGFPGFAMQSWFALVAPKGLPVQVQETLENALKSTMSDASLIEKLTNVGLEPKFESSTDYTTRVKSDIAKLEPIAKANNITRN